MKNTFLLILLLIAGSVIGALIASATGGVESLSWLSYSKEIAVSPFTVNLVIASITFGIDFSMSVAQVIFLIIAVAVYPKLKKVIA